MMSDDKVSVKEALEKDFGDPFKPCKVNEANQTVIKNGQAIIRGLRAGVGVIDPKIVESISQMRNKRYLITIVKPGSLR